MAKIVKCTFKNMCEDAEKKYLCCYYCDTPRCKYRCKDSVRACTYKEVSEGPDVTITVNGQPHSTGESFTQMIKEGEAIQVVYNKTPSVPKPSDSTTDDQSGNKSSDQSGNKSDDQSGDQWN